MKTINQEWEEFKNGVLVGAPESYIAVSRVAFFSGTIAMSHLQMTELDGLTEDQSILAMAGWNNEMAAFIDEMNPNIRKVQGHA